MHGRSARATPPICRGSGIGSSNSGARFSKRSGNAPVMLAVFSIVGLWMIRSLLHHRGRDRQVRMAAEAAGMGYREHDGFGLSKIALRRISVVMIRTWAPPLIVTSPVISPTSTSGSSRKSRYFWFERALIGAV